jgi:ribonuclease T2
MFRSGETCLSDIAGEFMAKRFFRTGLAAVVLGVLVVGTAAQDRRQNQPGKFDYYVLSLSWSPSFCEEAGERGQDRNQQCGTRPYGFVVHGFWPEYETGFPEYCRVPAPRLDRSIVSSMLDLMPEPRLIFREWDRHGTCSGLTPHAYFDTIRKARATVRIPESYMEASRRLTVHPTEVEEAFVKANPGLARDALSVTCDGSRLTEVRVCMSKELGFRDCPDVARRACRREQVVMPPMRGATAKPENASPVK